MDRRYRPAARFQYPVAATWRTSLGDDTQPHRYRPIRRLVAIAVGAIVVIELLYLAGANGFLHSQWGRETLNRKPEKLAITWQRAWTWFPGVLHVRDLEISGRARRAAWRTAIDNGRMVIFLPSLLRRHFRLREGHAQGGEIEVEVLPPPETPRPPKSGAPGGSAWTTSRSSLCVSFGSTTTSCAARAWPWAGPTSRFVARWSST